MNQSVGEAAAGGGTSDWEGSELVNNIWESDEQETTTSQQTPPNSRSRSNTIESSDSFGVIDFPESFTTDLDTHENEEFEPIDLPANHVYNTRHLRQRDVSYIHRRHRSHLDESIDLRHTTADEGVLIDIDSRARLRASGDMEAGASSNDTDWQQAGHNADALDLAGPGSQGYLLTIVDKAQKEAEGTQNAYISYLVTTETDFKSFQNSHSSVRRRFTDFVFLYKTLQKEYPQCAVPPLPDKHNMSYVRGDRFGQDFTSRRAHSLDRFLKRLTLHPVLRRAVILALFLESTDWNATMRSRPQRGMSGGETASSGFIEGWTDSLINAFAKTHKTDKRFADVNGRASKLNEDLGTVSRTVARVAKREADLEEDYSDLAIQFQKLAALEPGVADELTKFATSVQSTSEGWKGLKEHTDQNYLGSLKDMEAYIFAVKALLKTREQKQLDFEGLTDYLTKSSTERDSLASHGGATSTAGFLRQKLEDVRGVDHEQSRRERQRKLEVEISRLQTEVESSKKMSEAFDEEVVKEVQDFERIKAVEFRETLGGLADAHIDFFKGNIEIWEKFVKEMEEMEQAEGR